MERDTWSRWSSILLTLTLGGLLVYFGLRIAFPILLPFLLALLIALPLRPLSKKLSRILHLPHRLCAAVLLVLAVGGSAWGIGAVIGRLWQELVGLCERLIADGELQEALTGVGAWIDSLRARLGMETNAGQTEQSYRMVSELLGNLLSSLASGLPPMIGKMVSSLPSIFFSVILTVLAGYYFCVDGERIRSGVISLLPMRVRRIGRIARDQIRTAFARYIKAYLWLLLLTFACLLVGLLILRVEYAFLLALLIAVLDLLPVLGVGTVLIPWSIVMLIGQRYFLGFGLLLLYLTVTLIRQIVEPRLLGKSLGLHPMLTLFSTYAGFVLLGVFGMILGPIVAVLIKQAVELGREAKCEAQNAE
ncbi:MAG: sporulation integral membrane protein YtvI [Clostridia bacterium]|nr:sporulation integral membrane protein YtvI [Clostridia bacterium]